MLPGLTLLAAFAETPNYARVPPELTTQVGWLCLALLVLTLGWLATRMESVRRSFLALEDPRMFAVMRIGFAVMTIQNFWNLRPYWRMLWSDEGLFTLEEARQRLGSSALTGWTPEDGFLDFWAWGKFFWGKHSPFFLDASPGHVDAVMFVFFGVLLLYACGVLSRLTGLLAWLMVSGLYNHNALYLEGTDTVYRAFWFILLFCRTGAAWSVDNLVRCWWLRRRGRLQEVGMPPAPGRAPVYALVPSWPRYLMIGQLIAIYTSTGVVKTGSVWAAGDALYYSVNLDHFYRFEVWTQMVSATFGTNLFRLMTWVTWWWESCFAVAGLGMILKFGREHRDRTWYRAQQVPWRLWAGRALLLAGYIALYRIFILAYPYCVELPKDATAEVSARVVADGLARVQIALLLVVPVLTIVWFALARWPIHIRRWTLDQGSMRRWVFGRRTWLGLGLMFHGFLILFMNIGMFPFIMLMTYAAWLTGEELAAAVRWCVDLVHRSPLGRLLPARWFDHASNWTGPAQAPEDVPPRGRPIPDSLVVLLGLAALYLVWRRIGGDRELSTLVYGLAGLGLAIAVTCRLWRGRPATGAPALAYGPTGRFIALGFLISHALVIALSLGPNYSVFANWRGPTRSLFGSWLSVTGTAQSWKMFAPNPPRANMSMKTVVVAADGTRWNIGNNAIDYRPFPWVWNDRIRKMHRRMVSKGKWYLRHWTGFQCREWYLETGERALSVEVHKVVTRIPTPDQVATKGYYNPAQLKATDELVETHVCPLAGDLPPFMKLRRGWPLTAEETAQLEQDAERERKATETKRRNWANRRDWGGSGPPTPPTPRPAAPATPAGSLDEDTPAKDGGDGE